MPTGDIIEIIDPLIGSLHTIYDADLLAVWLGGSFARGCGSLASSDVDLLLVTKIETPLEKQVQVATFAEMQRFHSDLTAVSREQLNADIWPTPIDFLVKMDNKVVHKPEGSQDFLLLRQEISEAGWDLYGIPHADLIRPVHWSLLQLCIKYILPHIRPQFKNPALMLCRVVFTYTKRRLCSKTEAGHWAIGALPPAFNALIQADLSNYLKQGKILLDQKALEGLERYCFEAIDLSNSTYTV